MVLDKEQFDAFRMEIATFGNIPILFITICMEFKPTQLL